VADAEVKIASVVAWSSRPSLLLAAILVIAPPRPGSAERITVRADPPRLSWSLFRHVDSMPASSEDAHIAAEISFPQPLKMETIAGGFRLPPFAITVAPEPSRTMVRRSASTSGYLLRHEQGHYDIVFLAARALARELESITAPTADDLLRRVEDCVTEHTARAQRLSEAYDRETDRSRDPTAQARWNGLIAAALEAPAVARLAGRPL
jgi:hypothetical protein